MCHVIEKPTDPREGLAKGQSTLKETARLLFQLCQCVCMLGAAGQSLEGAGAQSGGGIVVGSGTSLKN